MTEALIETNFGKIKIKLLPEIAPETVRNFITLTKSSFYDGTLFHRVIPKFMIQGGDPNTKKSDKVQKSLGSVNSALAKAVKKGLIKKEFASRKLSSLSNQLKK